MRPAQVVFHESTHHLVFHESTHHRGHCATPGCVMTWSVDERATEFCASCKDDLRAIGGR